jgi:hypothetical protein
MMPTFEATVPSGLCMLPAGKTLRVIREQRLGIGLPVKLVTRNILYNEMLHWMRTASRRRNANSTSTMAIENDQRLAGVVWSSRGRQIDTHRITKMLPHRLTSYNTSRPVTTCSALEPSYYRSPSPGRVSSNSQKATRLPPRPSLDLKAAPPSVGRNKTVSPQDPANYTATNHAATSLPTPRPSLESPDNSQCLPPSHASDPTNPAVIAPFTPQPSSESAKKTHFLSFDQVVSMLKPLLDGTAGMAGDRKISLEGISPGIVDKLRAKSRASELPGWENLR